MVASPGIAVPEELGRRIGDLYCAYADALDEGALESWPDFFTENALYKVLPLENFERGLPVALISAESRAMLADRVVAIRELALYAPRKLRHMTANIRVREIGASGIRLTANFLLLSTMADMPTEVFLAGRYHDRVVEDGPDLRFAERICVYDSTIVPTSLVFPV
jgi:salicylate 5-hydroxylase small subunit